MTIATDLTTITGAEAYSKSVEYADKAVRYAEMNSEHGAQMAQAYAATAQAYAQIAQAEVAARASAKPGCYPEGGWKRHTNPTA